MCGILGGNGRLSDGKYKGIAPECNLIVGKVLNGNGEGSLTNLNRGLIWICEQLLLYPIRILNISIEMEIENNSKQEEIGLMNELMGILWQKGMIIIVSAGNKGPKPMSISMIGDQGRCICVGCHDDGYIGKNGKSCKDYSGRGPGKNTSQYGFGTNPIKKPDIVAPGTDIISCNYRIQKRGSRYINPYIAKSGTSMSAPIVSGLCALALQKYPTLANKDVIEKLKLTARDLGEKWNVQGAGMIQADNFIENIN